MLKFDFDSLLNTPFEKWPKHIKLRAVSANADGIVSGFLARVNGKEIYGSRKHEFINGRFTGKSSFVINKN